MNRPTLIKTTLLLAAAMTLAGCGHKTEQAAKSETLPSVAVHTETVANKPRTATEDVVGTVRAKLRAVIEAKVTGKISSLLVVPGQEVSADQTLATIDAREIQAQLDQANAVHQQAENDLKRAQSLFDQKILSQSELEAAQSKFRVATAAVTEAETLLGYTKVTAPFAGVITRKHADVGDLAMPGKALLEMEDARALRLEADVPEAVIANVKLGNRLPVRVSALDGVIEGVVSEISPAADLNSRTFLVKLDLPETTGLRTGQFGRVAMPVGTTQALRVPATAVVQRGQMELVFVVNDQHAQMRIVKTGKHIGNEIEIVSGLENGESVVADNAASLRDRQPVEAK